MGAFFAKPKMAVEDAKVTKPPDKETVVGNPGPKQQRMTTTPNTQASVFLWTLLEVSERAARIARTCREEKELFKLLVEEKKGTEKNTHFLQDFKTLADVFIQEMIKHYLTQKFPEIGPHIRGEESNEFTNTLGETIVLEMKPTREETAELLKLVMDGNGPAADLLARAAHDDAQVEDAIQRDFKSIEAQLQQQNVPLNDIGLWIDPVDGTQEYVSGKWDNDAQGEDAISKFGLNVCAILIGGYRRSTGEACFGVVTQPYSTPEGKPTKSYFAFGKVTNVKPRTVVKDIVLSPKEDAERVKALEAGGFTTAKCAGAGYKLLTVALGLCSVYVCPKPSSYLWDVCAPDALLQAQGGGVNSFKENIPIKYNIGEDKALAKNFDGTIAYRDEKDLKKVLEVLASNKPKSP